MTDKTIEIPEEIKEKISSGEFIIDEIILDKDGNWFHNGQPFSNKKIIDLFNRSIHITEDGTYALHYDVYTYPIIVEDTPYFISGVRFEGFGDFEKIYINISDGESEELDIDTLYYRKTNNALYCRIKDGVFPAKFRRSPSFHVLERIDEVNGDFILNLCGRKIHLKQED